MALKDVAVGLCEDMRNATSLTLRKNYVDIKSANERVEINTFTQKR